MYHEHQFLMMMMMMLDVNDSSLSADLQRLTWLKVDSQLALFCIRQMNTNYHDDFFSMTAP